MGMGRSFLCRTTIIKVVLACAVLLISSSLWADTIDFSTPTGILGTSATYTSGSNSITAYGFECDNGGIVACLTGTSLASGVTANATDLYGKNAGAGEQGLGISVDPLLDNEISADTFITLNMSNVGGTSGMFTFDSVQTGESLMVCYGNNDSGWNNGLCTSFAGDGTNNPGGIFTTNLNWNGYSDISVIGVNRDVLISGVTVPEPGSLALFGSGLLGLIGFARRKFTNR